MNPGYQTGFQVGPIELVTSEAVVGDITLPYVTRVPPAPPSLGGLVAWQGDAAAVLSLEPHLGLPLTQPLQGHRAIILKRDAVSVLFRIDKLIAPTPTCRELELWQIYETVVAAVRQEALRLR